MAIKFTNNASATLASSINSSATSIILSGGQGALFPSLAGSDYFYATLVDSSNNIEIVKVTARSTDTLTVVRGQDGTSGRAYSSGDRIELRVVAASLQELVYQSGAATTSTPGLVQLTNSVSSTSTTTAATPASVKSAYDLANAAMPKTGGAFTGNITAPYISAAGATNGVYFEDRNGSASGSWIWYAQAGTAYLYSGAASENRYSFDAGGNFTATGDVTAYSDERLKSDIHTITNALSTVDQLRGTAFVKDGKASIGVIAQEVQRVLPQVVHENADGYLSVAYGNLSGLLIEAVKELNTKVKKLEAK